VAGTKAAHDRSSQAENDLAALDLIATDKLDNVGALQETLRAKGAEATWSTFNAERSSQRWYYRALAAALLDRKPGSALMRTLDSEVHVLFPDPRVRTPFFPGRPRAPKRVPRAADRDSEPESVAPRS
jgi:hypothetical protein